MKNIFSKPLGFFKRHKKKSIAGLVVLALILFFVMRRGKSDAFTLNEAKTGSVVQEVSITGKVVSSQAVNLSFEQSGRVNYIGVKGGQRVRTGQILMSLDAGEAAAQRQRELANVSAAQIRLDQALASNDLNTLEITLKNNEKNLTQTRTKASTDRARSSIQTAINAIVALTDMQYKYFNEGSLPEAIEIASAKEKTLKAIYDQNGLGKVGSWYFLPLKTGLNETLIEAEKHDSNFNYEELLRDTKSALNSARDALAILSGKMSGVIEASPMDKATVNANIDLVNNQISAITAQEQAIISAQNAVNDAKARLQSSNTFDVGLARADLERAKASLALVYSQLSKYHVRSPFNGIASNIDVKVGQIVSPSTPAASIIGDAKFQVETNISEADIAKIKVGDESAATLDAYGKDQKFKAKVIHIDPAGRSAGDVVTYKVKLEFTDNDTRLLSGLTADVDILTDKEDNVIYVPTRDIISRDDKKFVKVAIKEDANDEHLANFSLVLTEKGYKVFEVPVETGLRGSDGKTEIKTGIKAGDMVVSD